MKPVVVLIAVSLLVTRTLAGGTYDYRGGIDGGGGGVLSGGGGQGHPQQARINKGILNLSFQERLPKRRGSEDGSGHGGGAGLGSGDGNRKRGFSHPGALLETYGGAQHGAPDRGRASGRGAEYASVGVGFVGEDSGLGGDFGGDRGGGEIKTLDGVRSGSGGFGGFGIPFDDVLGGGNGGSRVGGGSSDISSRGPEDELSRGAIKVSGERLRKGIALGKEPHSRRRSALEVGSSINDGFGGEPRLGKSVDFVGGTFFRTRGPKDGSGHSGPSAFVGGSLSVGDRSGHGGSIFTGGISRIGEVADFVGGSGGSGIRGPGDGSGHGGSSFGGGISRIGEVADFVGGSGGSGIRGPGDGSGHGGSSFAGGISRIGEFPDFAGGSGGSGIRGPGDGSGHGGSSFHGGISRISDFADFDRRSGQFVFLGPGDGSGHSGAPAFIRRPLSDAHVDGHEMDGSFSVRGRPGFSEVSRRGGRRGGGRGGTRFFGGSGSVRDSEFGDGSGHSGDGGLLY